MQRACELNRERGDPISTRLTSPSFMNSRPERLTLNALHWIGRNANARTHAACAEPAEDRVQIARADKVIRSAATMRHAACLHHQELGFALETKPWTRIKTTTDNRMPYNENPTGMASTIPS